MISTREIVSHDKAYVALVVGLESSVFYDETEVMQSLISLSFVSRALFSRRCLGVHDKAYVALVVGLESIVFYDASDQYLNLCSLGFDCSIQMELVQILQG